VIIIKKEKVVRPTITKNGVMKKRKKVQKVGVSPHPKQKRVPKRKHVFQWIINN
jgi:hypothetical protein